MMCSDVNEHEHCIICPLSSQGLHSARGSMMQAGLFACKAVHMHSSIVEKWLQVKCSPCKNKMSQLRVSIRVKFDAE